MARFDSDSIIERRLNPLLAAQAAFGRLNGNMPQKELDHSLGAPFAHLPPLDIAKLAFTRPGLADAGSVYAVLL